MAYETARFLSLEARILTGIKQVVTIARPAAGADWTTTVPGGEQWRVLAGRFSLTTSAAAPTRLIQVPITVDGIEIFRAVDSTAVPASTTRNDSIAWSAAPTLVGQQNQQNFIQIPLMWLPQGATIASLTLGLDVADQYSAVNLYVERYLLSNQALEAALEEAMYEYAQHAEAKHADSQRLH